MANQSRARLAGDDYQHLLSWYYALEILRRPQELIKVFVEHDASGSFDDVVVNIPSSPVRFIQIKYHVDQRGSYSTAVMTMSKKAERSLLKKTFDTWKLLKEQNPNRDIELMLQSIWIIDSNDKVFQCIDSANGKFLKNLFTASENTDISRERQKWIDHLSIAKEEFEEFGQCLRFRLGLTDTEELSNMISERMENLGLKYDETALILAAGIVRKWVTQGKQEVTLSFLREEIKKYDLELPNPEEKSVTVHMVSIKEKKFALEPDYFLDWRSYFEGLPNNRGHKLKNSDDWNNVLLPQLNEIESRIATETGVSLVKVKGLSRLSCWFGFGYVFREVSGYVLDVDQYGKSYRTDATPATDFLVNITSQGDPIEGEAIKGTGNTVAVGVSITNSLEDDVRRYLTENGTGVASLLLLQPNRPLGKDCIRGPEDVAALADQFKKLVIPFIKKWQATKLMIFYYGPLTGACFIGHSLNAVCREIQIMEDQQPGYAPSFLLQ